MEIQHVLTVTAGILFLGAFIPYILTIVHGETQPAKGSWLVWASLDSITIAGMFFKHTVNGQIVGAVVGAWAVVVLALIYGKSGWTRDDKWCLGGGLLGIALWLMLGEANFAIVASNSVIFLGAIPTFKSAWQDPSKEDKVAWTIWWFSCVAAVFAIPAWTLADAIQPLTFFTIETMMVYILYIRPRALARVHA